jgi:hypothetical protein
MHVLCLCCGAALAVVNVVAAQVIGNEAAMDRLREKAEEATANDDPEGAAMNMGRAALMAKLLAKTHHEDVSAVRPFQQDAEKVSPARRRLRLRLRFR